MKKVFILLVVVHSFIGLVQLKDCEEIGSCAKCHILFGSESIRVAADPDGVVSSIISFPNVRMTNIKNWTI